jgi:hypothetical protein
MDFVKRNLFWIGMGALALAGGVVLAVWGIPARGANAKGASALKGEASRVSPAAARQDLKNTSYAEREEKKQEVLEDQWKRTLRELEGRDKAIEQKLKDPDDSSRFVDDEDGGTWKRVYAQQMSSLLERMYDSFVEVGASPIVVRSYQNIWPKPEEIRRETKRFWIQYYIVNAIAGLNKEGLRPVVPVFDTFSFVPQPDRLLETTHQTLFKPVPFALQVFCEFRYVPLVMSNLRGAANLNVYVTTMSLDRVGSGRTSRRMGGGMGMGAGGMMPGGSMAFSDPLAGYDPMMDMAVGRPSTMPSRPLSGRPGVLGTRQQEQQAVLPATLVRTLIKGYVADYVGEEQEQSQGQGLVE